MRRSLFLSSLVSLSVACGADPAPTPPAPTTPALTAPVLTSPAAASGGLSPTDAAYARLAVPQAESALPLLDAVRARATDPELAGLAARAGVGHREELAALHAVLRDAGLPHLDEHAGHDMPGMITAEELRDVDRLTGADFDARARVLLRAHFEESAAVARSALEAATDPGLLALTRRLHESRGDYLSELSIP